jgi:hypothetical protein
VRDKAFLRRWDLLLPAVLAPVAETSLLRIFGPMDGASLGPQVTAPPPFDLFHDLRWISVYHNSWALLALELVGMLALRSAFVAWMVHRSWPGERPPPMLAAARRTLAFYAVGAVLFSPWVTILFGLAVTHLSYLFFVGLPPAVVIALAIHRGALAQAAGHWWRWRPSWRSLAWAGGAFIWLTLAGAVAGAAPAPVAILAAALAGILNARAYVGIVADLVEGHRAVATLRRWHVPVALAATFAVVVGGVQLGFAASRHPAPLVDTAGPSIPLKASGHPVLVAAGFSSTWGPAPVLRLPQGYVAWRFSYRGLDRDRRPLPYGPGDTLQPLATSAARMGQQIQALSQAYGEPVTIVAESEGGLVARTYLLRVYRPRSGLVNHVVILDMPRGSSSVYYPRQGSQGWGVGSGWALRGLAAIVRSLGPVPASADAPFIRDLVECGGLITEVTATPPPEGVNEVSIEALADSVDDAGPLGLAGAATYVVAAAHGGLVHRPDVQDQIFALLTDPATVAPSRASLARLVSAASQPWETPGLAHRLQPMDAC